MADRISFVQFNTLADFQAFQDKDDFALYFIVETQQIYKGNRLFSSNFYAGDAQYWIDHKNDIYPKGAALFDWTSGTIKIATGKLTVDQLPTHAIGNQGILIEDDGSLFFDGTAKAVKGKLYFGTVDNPHLYSYNGSEDIEISIYSGE